MLYETLRWVFEFVFRYFYRREIYGLDNLPYQGPYILCPNHFSWWDPPLVCSLVKKHQVYFMAKEELFKMPVLGQVLPRVNAFPVRRGTADRKAIKTSLDVLKKGNILGLFPEGTQNKTNELLLPPQPGIGLIALKSEAPVIPVAIIGPYRLFKPVKVKIGKPLEFSEYYGEKASAEQLDKVALTIMAEIRRLHLESST